MKDHPQAEVVKLWSHVGYESLCWVMFFPETTMQDSLVTEIEDLKLWQTAQKANTEKDHAAWNPASRSHLANNTDVFMCYWWYSLSPLSGDCWESFLAREHTPQLCWKGSTGMLSAADKWGHRGSCLLSRLIVLEALICQGSAGNQVGIYSTLFIGWFSPRLAKKDISISSPCTPLLRHPAPASRRCSDDKTISCLSCCSVWRWAHPPYLLVAASFSACFTKLELGSKTNLKYAFSHANMRMFGNFSHCNK